MFMKMLNFGKRLVFLIMNISSQVVSSVSVNTDFEQSCKNSKFFFFFVVVFFFFFFCLFVFIYIYIYIYIYIFTSLP